MTNEQVQTRARLTGVILAGCAIVLMLLGIFFGFNFWLVVGALVCALASLFAFWVSSDVMRP